MEVFLHLIGPVEIGKTYHNKVIRRPPINGQPSTVVHGVSYRIVRLATWQDWANQIQEESGEPVPDWMLTQAQTLGAIYAAQMD